LGNPKPAGGAIGVLRSVAGFVRLSGGLRESGEKLVGLLQILVANAAAARPRFFLAVARVFRVTLLGEEICKKGDMEVWVFSLAPFVHHHETNRELIPL
jgi:hypothetical protein